MRHKIFPIIVLMVLGVQGAYAEVYKWVDDKGGTHFTDDPTFIPEKYKKAINKMELRDERTETKEQDNPPPSMGKSSYKDSLGRDESYWRGRVEEWKKKIANARENVEFLRGKYNDLTEKYNSSRSSAERASIRNEREKVKSDIDHEKLKIDEAQAVIDKKIPEEAELYKAKKEWLKP
jgi:hypothetical protein